MEDKIHYLYNTYWHEIKIAVGDDEKEKIFSQKSDWTEITQDEYYMIIRDSVATAIGKLKNAIEKL